MSESAADRTERMIREYCENKWNTDSDTLNLARLCSTYEPELRQNIKNGYGKLDVPASMMKKLREGGVLKYVSTKGVSLNMNLFEELLKHPCVINCADPNEGYVPETVELYDNIYNNVYKHKNGESFQHINMESDAVKALLLEFERNYHETEE